MSGFETAPLSTMTPGQQPKSQTAARPANHTTATLSHYSHKPSVSIVIPARNEAASLHTLLSELCIRYPDYRLIVVDDGSTDDTCIVARGHGADVISHPYRLGNGAAVKAGARLCTSEIVVFMDGDGQHRPKDIQRLIDKLQEGYDMVVGARDWRSQSTFGRGIANGLYNRLASWMVGHRIDDLTSGFRAVSMSRLNEFLHLLPNGFSYPTTITMALFRAGYNIAYLPIHANERTGRSHIKPLRDGLRFLLIIFRIGTLYSPLKLFLPVSFTFLFLGVSYYSYTFFTQERFTNMSALLLVTSVLIFLIGLVSEQITSLTYSIILRTNPITSNANDGQELSHRAIYNNAALQEAARPHNPEAVFKHLSK